MVKLFDASGNYIEAEVSEFYCNALPNFFALTGKKTFFRDALPIYNVPRMITGNRPADGGHLIIEAKDYDDFIAREPKAAKWIRPFLGALEFIRGKKRYCLWLVDCPPNELRKMPLIYQRVQLCREDRLKGAPDRQKLAATPWLFRETKNPANYLVVPRHSSERRDYIPIGYMDANTIVNDSVLIIPNAKYWHFGVLTSLPHMAWMRVTCGRLTSRYRYSAEIVYNNFPWPPFNREVELTAWRILEARKKYPDASFADLYDPLIMPKDLRRAHEANDRAVMEAYDFPRGMTEDKMFLALQSMYDSLVNLEKIFMTASRGSESAFQ